MKCKYCDGTGEMEVLMNYAEYHYEADEPIVQKFPCEECNNGIMWEEESEE